MSLITTKYTTGKRQLREGPNPRSTRGFTLLEVLIALIILAIGILGLTALQARGLKFTHDAYIRSQATVLAYDIVERMRNNPTNAAAYVAAAAPGGACVVTAASVTNDLRCWYAALATDLPEGTGAIAVDPGNPNGFLITLSWRDRETGVMKPQQWAVEP